MRGEWKRCELRWEVLRPPCYARSRRKTCCAEKNLCHPPCTVHERRWAARLHRLTTCGRPQVTGCALRRICSRNSAKLLRPSGKWLFHLTTQGRSVTDKIASFVADE